MSREIQEEVLKNIEDNVDKSKKTKPQALGGIDGLCKIKGTMIKELKTLAVPKGDPKKSNKIQGIAWAPGGSTGEISTRLAFARQDHFVGVIDVKRNLAITGCKAPFTQCMAIHPTTGMVLTGGMNNATIMWKPSDSKPGQLQEVHTWIEHDGYISSLHFLPGGLQYISAAGDADSRIFDVETRQCVSRFCGHEKDSQSISFAKDDKGANVFATCSSDKTVKIWDRRTTKCTHSLKTDSELNACCMFPRELTMVACGGEKDKTYLFDIRACKEVSKYARNNQKTASVAFSSSGRHLYVGHDDGALITWDIFASGANKEYASKIEAHTTFEGPAKKIDITTSRIQELSLSHDGVLASCGFDGAIKIWTAPAPTA